jgi:cobalamin transport system substrate-binding protein
MAAPRFLRFLTLAVLLVLAGCTTSTANPSTGPTGLGAPPSVAAPSVAITPTALSYPLGLTDDEGTLVTIPAAPARIVSLTPATTETLFAIGAGPKIVGRTDSDDYPAQASSIPIVVSLGVLDVEKIVGLAPDLVVAGGNGFNSPDSIAKLRSLGIPVVVVYAPTVDGVLDDIRLIGLAAGAPDAANALADSMSTQIDAINAITDPIEPPTVFYEIDASSKIYTAADQSFLAEMITIAGGIAVTTGSTASYEISLEQLIDADPAVILLGDAAYGVTPDQVKARSGWGTISAVATGSIYPVDDTVITRPGPRLVQGLLDLVRAIHPELDLGPLGSGGPASSAAPGTS